ncbi:GntR family transcriptional regulator [Intrasporangium calvum]|uniref:GntR family transcriptional regulator n=1 Tax=Intrasporangium calvum TaxID=53358 RepID=UPI000DF5FD90|nr:GntR family transcriptional regulator [Intrasporangium calvum]AXG14533.1 GntR family transcriptional regulator [Intrasporangium calvum]
MSAAPYRRPPTAQEAVLAELRRAIASGELKPGQPIAQAPLAERLGVSRVPVREALKILQGEGQVEYQPHHGYSVTRLDLDDLREAYRIRQLLETEAVRIAVPRFGPEEVAALAQAAREVDNAGDHEDYATMAAANRRFHFLLVEGAGLPRLTHLVRILWDATDVYRSFYYADAANRHRVRAEHAGIVQAVADGDLEAVVRQLDAHRRHAIDEITGAMSVEGARQT